MSGARPEGPAGIGQLLGDVATDLQDLVRGEVRLARAEIDQKLDRLITSAIWLGGGALVAFAGLVVFLMGLAAILGLFMPAWLALFLVGAAIIVVGGLVARSGLEQLSLKSLVPDQTASSLGKDVRVVKEHI